jgi:hypothetical protein
MSDAISSVLLRITLAAIPFLSCIQLLAAICPSTAFGMINAFACVRHCCQDGKPSPNTQIQDW